MVFCRSLCFVRLLFAFLSGETVTSHGSIEPDKDSIREEPYSLPQGFSWDTLDLGNPAVVRKCKNTNSHSKASSSFRNKVLDSWCFSLCFKKLVDFCFYSNFVLLIFVYDAELFLCLFSQISFISSFCQMFNHWSLFCCLFVLVLLTF